MKKANTIAIIISLLLLVSSCNFIYGVKDLGKGYFYDIKYVVYVEDNEYKGVGTLVIPENVICLKYNNDYVLAISLNYKNQLCYWLIDKTKASREIGFLEETDLLESYYKFENIKFFENRETFENEIKLMNINPNNSDWECAENGNPNLEKFLINAHQTYGFVEKSE